MARRARARPLWSRRCGRALFGKRPRKGAPPVVSLEFKKTNPRHTSPLKWPTRQKMHLELARAYLRGHDTRLAVQHIRSGLSVKEGRADYRRDLETILHDLRNEQPMLFPPE